MGVDAGMCAWEIMQRYADYRKDWQASAAAPVFEEAPFPIRVQTDADLLAAPWRLLAWEDPESADTVSPFWIGAPTVEGAPRPGAPPLAAMAEEPGAGVEGLRLLDGGLVLKIVRGVSVIRILVRDGGPFPADGGLEVVHGFGLRMPQTAATLLDFWAVAGEPAPSRAWARRGWIAGFWPRWTGSARS